MQSLIVMQELIDRLPARLQALPSDKVKHKPAPDKWSAKEELGHLLDSAANNHQRIVRTPAREGELRRCIGPSLRNGKTKSSHTETPNCRRERRNQLLCPSVPLW